MGLTYADLVDLVETGETNTFEVKEKLTREVANGFSTDIAALANSNGGRIAFGISNGRQLVGCRLTADERDRVSQAAKDCGPAVSFLFEEVQDDGKWFSVISVPRSPVFHSDVNKKVPIRVGTITAYLDALGIITLARERSITIEGIAQQDTRARSTPRTEFTDEEVAVYLDGLRVPDPEARAALLRHLANRTTDRRVFANKALVAAVPRASNAAEKVVRLGLFELFRLVAYRGDEEERKNLEGFLPGVMKVAVSTTEFEVCRTGLEVLVVSQSSLALELVEYLIREASDELYGATNMIFVFQNNRSRVPGLELTKLFIRMSTQQMDPRAVGRLRKLMNEAVGYF